MCATMQLTTGEWMQTAAGIKSTLGAEYAFGGFARIETLQTGNTWDVVKRFAVPVKGFSERLHPSLRTHMGGDPYDKEEFEFGGEEARMLVVLARLSARRETREEAQDEPQYRVVTVPTNVKKKKDMPEGCEHLLGLAKEVQARSGHDRMPFFMEEKAA